MPTALAATAFLILAVQGWRHAEITKFPVVSSGSVSSMRPLACERGGFTLAELRAIRAGRAGSAAERELVGCVTRWIGNACPRDDWLDRATVHAGFDDRDGIRLEVRHTGWPAPWVTRNYQARYTDVFRKAGAMPYNWQVPRQTGASFTLKSLGTAPSITSSQVSARAIALSLLVVIAAFHGASGLAWFWCRLRRRRAPRWRAGIAGAMVALIVVAVGTVTGNPDVSAFTGMSPSSRSLDEPSYLGKSHASVLLRRLHHAAHEGGAATARLLLTEAPPDIPDDHALKLGLTIPNSQAGQTASFGWPERWLSWSKHANTVSVFGEHVAGTRVGYRWWPSGTVSLQAVSRSLGKDDPHSLSLTARTVGLHLDRLALPILAVWLLCMASGGCYHVVHSHVLRGRLQRALCTNCGYCLALPAPADTPVESRTSAAGPATR